MSAGFISPRRGAAGLGTDAASIPTGQVRRLSPAWRLPDRDPAGRWIPDTDPPDCWHCDRPRAGERRGDRGLCVTCHRRWSDHGFTGTVPPPLARTGWRGETTRAERLAEAAELEARGLNLGEVAARMGITRRTLLRYRAERRAAGVPLVTGPTTRRPLRSGSWGSGMPGLSAQRLAELAELGELVAAAG